MRFVVPGDEVDDGDVALLAITVAASDPLLDPLRVPWQIVVDDGLADLKVQPLRSCLCAHEDLRPHAELVNECEPHGNFSGRLRAWRKFTPFFL